MLFEHNNPFERGCPDDFTGSPQPKRQSGFEDIPAVERCLDRSHEPPTHLHIPQGKRYRHVCPSCGFTILLEPPQITFQVEQQPRVPDRFEGMWQQWPEAPDNKPA